MTRQEKLLINILVDKKTFKGKVNKEIISLAQKNRVLYQLAIIGNLKNVRTEGEEWIKKLRKTLLLINKELKGIPFLITRTYKYIPYVTFDVDLFVKDEDYARVIKIFNKIGFSITSHDSSLGGRLPNRQKNIDKEGFLTIDLHRDFTWQKRRFLDKNLLFKNIREREIAGVLVPIPSPEIEFLLCLADVMHERFNFTLLDLIWVMGLSNEIKDWSFIENQVENYGWIKSYNYICQAINTFSEEIYSQKIVPKKGKLAKSLSIPYFIPLNISFLTYLENFKKNKRFPLVSFLYMIYSRSRYCLSGKKRMPFYSNWYE